MERESQSLQAPLERVARYATEGSKKGEALMILEDRKGEMSTNTGQKKGTWPCKTGYKVERSCKQFVVVMKWPSKCT